MNRMTNPPRMREHAVSKGGGPGGSVGLYEKHRKVYARSVRGVFNNWRWAMVWLTQLLFYGMAWFNWGDRQAVLLYLAERKFYIFGVVFWPQDAIYLAVLLIVAASALFLVTAVAGRLFCGYACPQTVYTEVFMWIERKVEGDRAARMKLDAQPMSAHKFGVKVAKHALWLLVAGWTGFTFVGYFTPIRDLAGVLTGSSPGGWNLFWVFFYSGFLYLMAGFMREQMCKYLCPYARFQGVMFDPDTLIIGYDVARGEPRGPLRKNAVPEKARQGDCIDCGLCVQVCPTGIDIRKGLQLECIACAACIDACDEVMDKIKLPRGLIRYSTENVLAGRGDAQTMRRHLLRPRTLIYASFLVVIVSIAGWSLLQRTPLKVDVIRDRATLYREAEEGRIENIYRLYVMNTDERPHHYSIQVSGIDGISIVGENQVDVPAVSNKNVLIVASVEEGAAASGSSKIRFDVRSTEDGTIKVQEQSTFFMP